ncbi:FtsK/SpoIIIE family DNA translocase [Fenollaria massiliensis]|uniref:FtsK/SpoIIIE family DNA translocase n=1 Tax=Fenollaria massiliensis TaxID=938288 RepID=UPI00036738FB|nr:DNA translocase FtsK [Fenollaria massiliensis]
MKTTKKRTNIKNKSKINKKVDKNESLLISGLIILFASIFLLIFANSDATGVFGRWIKSGLVYLFSLGYNIFLFYLLAIALVLLIPKSRPFAKKLIISLSIIFLSLLIIFDSSTSLMSSFSAHVSQATESAGELASGGLIGGVFGFLFYRLFGGVGTVIILVIINIINIYTLTSIKRADIIQKTDDTMNKIQDGIETSVEKIKIKRQEMRNKKILSSDDIFNDEDDIKTINSESDTNTVTNTNDINLEGFDDDFIDIKINDSSNTKNTEAVDKTEDDLKAKENPKTDKKPKTIKKEIEKTRKTEETEDNNEEIDIEKEIHKEDIVHYEFPSLNLLKEVEVTNTSSKGKEIKDNIKIIQDTLNNFGVDAKVIGVNSGPTITSYEISLAAGVKVSKILSLSDNLALALATTDIRILAPIPGKSAVGIEVPNKNKDTLLLKEILDSDEFRNLKSKLPLALGKDVTGNTIISSIANMPHLLIAGATGSGKSVCINTIIMSILYKARPDEVKLIMIDPKVVELNVYNNIPHLLIPVVTNAKKAQFSLNWAVQEMEKRYQLFAKNNVKDMQSYNELDTITEKMPQIVIIIDELADLMMVAATEVEDAICRLAQMARAAGMHLIVATQRPSVDVITGTIKANIPSRISFQVSSQIDSRTILDMSGAEKLLGKGDMLYYPSNLSKPIRVQGAFVSDKEVKRVCDFIRNQGEANYNQDAVESISTNNTSQTMQDDKDDLYDEAVKLVVADGQASISYLQRKLKIGYSRAARIVDQMEEMGVVSGYDGSKPRKVLIEEEDLENLYGESGEGLE